MFIRKPPLPLMLLNNVSCMRNAQSILCNINASVHERSCTRVLTGANGARKSTFLLILACFSRLERSCVFELLGLGRFINEKARMLSMGQGKRLQLARAVALNRPIWLLDEPSVALDTGGVKLLEYIIAEHRKKGRIVLIATHLFIQIDDAMILRLPERFPRRKNHG
ncbi:hypothetical protein MKX01_001836 [Papaver californicum]|nr:hypothetical protein MKX01_001836 [Papaver californicum]